MQIAIDPSSQMPSFPTKIYSKFGQICFCAEKCPTSLVGEQLTEFTPEFWLFSVGLIPETVD
jgi:hypothetical protein